jgi:uncharacterized protein
VFVGTYVEFDDTRRDYGERRVVALGLADEIPLTVVFTDRIMSGGAIVRRIISARLSHRKERRRYAEAIREATPPFANGEEDADRGSG